MRILVKILLILTISWGSLWSISTKTLALDGDSFITYKYINGANISWFSLNQNLNKINLGFQKDQYLVDFFIHEPNEYSSLGCDLIYLNPITSKSALLYGIGVYKKRYWSYDDNASIYVKNFSYIVGYQYSWSRYFEIDCIYHSLQGLNISLAVKGYAQKPPSIQPQTY